MLDTTPSTLETCLFPTACLSSSFSSALGGLVIPLMFPLLGIMCDAPSPYSRPPVENLLHLLPPLLLRSPRSCRHQLVLNEDSIFSQLLDLDCCSGTAHFNNDGVSAAIDRVQSHNLINPQQLRLDLHAIVVPVSLTKSA